MHRLHKLISDHLRLQGRSRDFAREELFDKSVTHEVKVDVCPTAVLGMTPAFSGQKVIILQQHKSWVEILTRGGATSYLPLAELEPLWPGMEEATHEVIHAWTKQEADAWDPNHKDDYMDVDLLAGFQLRLLGLTADGWAEICFEGLLGWIPFGRVRSLMIRDD